MTKRTDPNPDRCTSCGGPRNHYVDGKLRAKCSSCNDYVGRTKQAPKVFTPRREIPTLDPQARDLLRQIDELLEDERYLWAEDTLSGIQETVNKSGRCSEGQRRAVQNIEDAGTRRRER